jgi:pimeloyl-ACP methyl ester carboxylesterase
MKSERVSLSDDQRYSWRRFSRGKRFHPRPTVSAAEERFRIGEWIWYAVFGEGRPVLLLHGGLANSNYWGNLVPVLVRNHFEVILADSLPV